MTSTNDIDDDYGFPGSDPSSKAQDEQPEGIGFRPAFHALWHLPKLGVVYNLDTYAGCAWDDADKGLAATRIALIDTAVDHKHPNLEGAIDAGLMRDFSGGGTGAFVVREWADLSPADCKARIELLEKIQGEKDAISNAIREEVKWIEDKTANPRPERLPRVAPGALYGAHGTAVAGLIGARPRPVQLRHPKFTPKESEKKTGTISLNLPYCGINPFCRIIPISVTAVPGPEMLLGALEYAALIEPDIVVIADSWDGALDEQGGVSGAWRRVDDALTDLCERHIVLCAAGNEALDWPVYPASRCNDKIEGNDAPGPWAVGACDTFGKDLTYSPVQATIVALGGWMIQTLSTEVPLFDENRTRIDPWEIADDILGTPKYSEGFPPADIVTTDLPGRAGYNPSPYRHRPDPGGPYYEIASLFCRFAGTSAAVAIAAGLVSLIPRGKRRPNGRPSGTPSGNDMNKLFGIDLAKALFGKASGSG
ncbi:S8/S53 family peptidase [Maliponia aquimaris]|uniref:Peptidase S8/S53 domain-containing protein n=1 Tax=Maliponia aquimaris TaxID=1673631 RepID=A0A238KMF0_9RHOB|nr:S8/S53 family peptidase [Maliponia aquimaris]SMX43923.1 hypothetical protein MAA8898_02936 [Maliponia aquimaris]